MSLYGFYQRIVTLTSYFLVRCIYFAPIAFCYLVRPIDARKHAPVHHCSYLFCSQVKVTILAGSAAAAQTLVVTVNAQQSNLVAALQAAGIAIDPSTLILSVEAPASASTGASSGNVQDMGIVIGIVVAVVLVALWSCWAWWQARAQQAYVTCHRFSGK